MSGHHAVSCVVRCQIRMSGRLLHSLQYHFTFPQVAGPTWHPVVVVQPKLMSARTDHRPPFNIHWTAAPPALLVPHSSSSATHTGYRERGRGRDVHAAGAGNMLKHTHMTLDSSAGLLGG